MVSKLFILQILYWLCCVPTGSVATAEDPAAIATIQSAATFTDQPIKYLFKTEGAGGQVGVSQHVHMSW